MNIHLYPLSLQNLNLKGYPDKIYNKKNNKFSLTIGDLHGNALLLVYYLIKFDVIRLSKNKYSQLVALYYAHEHYLQENIPFDKLKGHIEKFHQICQSIQWNTKLKVYIRLIGDELCDRGANDYFMIILLGQMARYGIDFKILISNHGVNFLGSVFNDIYKKIGSTIGDDYCRSYENLKKLNSRYKTNAENLFTQELDIWLASVYLPRLLLIDYDFNVETNALSIYTHAPQGLNEIKLLFDFFGLAFNSQSTLAIATSIIAFQAYFQHTFSQSYEGIIKMFQTEHSLLREFVWNRDAVQISKLPIHFIHGHHRYDNAHPQLISLDDTFGKGGIYEVKTTSQLVISRDSSLCYGYASLLQPKILKHLYQQSEKYSHLKLIQKNLILLEKTFASNDLNLISAAIENLKIAIDEIRPKLSPPSIFSKLTWFVTQNQTDSCSLCEQIGDGVELLEQAFKFKN